MYLEFLGKMEDKAQAKPDASDTSVFHHDLIKLLVIEELNRLNRGWLAFILLSGYELDVATPSTITPKSKMYRKRHSKDPRSSPKRVSLYLL